jgi:hypothetical protein
MSQCVRELFIVAQKAMLQKDKRDSVLSTGKWRTHLERMFEDVTAKQRKHTQEHTMKLRKEQC